MSSGIFPTPKSELLGTATLHDQDDAQPKAEVRSTSPYVQPTRKSIFDSTEILGSVAFITIAGLCIVSATVLVGKQETDLPSNADCSQIQASGSGDRYTGEILHNRTSNLTDCQLQYTNQKRFERMFVLDVKSAAIFTFAQIKVLDVVWNLFAGQGLRFLMGFVTCMVFTHWLTSKAPPYSVAYPLYTTVRFEGTTLASTHQSTKAFFTLLEGRLVPSKSRFFFLLWMSLSMIYTLFVPVLVNAASGYILPSTAVWKMPDGSWISDLYPAYRACWHVKDGSRIDFDDNSVVSGPILSVFNAYIDIEERKLTNQSTLPDSGFRDFDDLQNYYLQVYQIHTKARRAAQKLLWKPREGRTWEDTNAEEQAIDQHTLALYANTTTQINFRGKIHHIPGPPLDLGSISLRNKEYFIDACFSEVVSDMTMKRRCYDGSVVPMDYTTPMSCSNTSEFYSWGFSSKMLVGILFTHAVWCGSTWTVWVWARRASRRLGRKRMGIYQTAIVLVNSLRREVGDEIEELTENELEKRLDGKWMALSRSRL